MDRLGHLVGLDGQVPGILKLYTYIIGFTKMPHRAPVAQLAEQIPLKDKVPGSNPGGGTKINL